MAQIINHNPEDNPQLNELYEIMLLAGYFRIRIASLKAFDKVIGGMAWCITSSNFAIDVQYNDQMQIGQKIKVSEKICEALQSMKCPYTLQPFQLQGLDVNSIYPVIQWLVKHVYETRFQTMRYNRDLSYLLGKKILAEYDQGNAHKVPILAPKRIKVNRAMASAKYQNPLRVYSALLQFDDKSSLRMYNKLLHLANKKQTKSAGNQNKPEQHKDQFAKFLHEEEKDQKVQQSETSLMKDFGSVGKMNLQRLEKMIEESKNQIQMGIIEEDEFEEQQSPLKQQQQQQQLSSQARKIKGKEDKLIKQYRLQAQKYETQLQAINSQLESYTNLEKQIGQQYSQVRQKYQIVNQQLEETLQQKSQLDQLNNQIQREIKEHNLTSNKKLQSMVQRRMELKKRKAQIKKKAKARLQQLQRKKQMCLSAVPQIDEQAFNRMLEEADIKKRIYNQKYQQLTTINQELAILQRKAQNFTSPAQIAQYHQRFVELFQAINYLIEQKRSIYSEVSNLESTQKIVDNFLKILNNTKESFREAKKKSEKKELAVDLKQICTGLEANMNNSFTTLKKIEGQRESSYGEYLDLIKLEREYLKQLRLLKVQYENAQKYYRQ